MESPAHVDLPAELPRRLKAARILAGLKARDLARTLGWSEEKVYRLERGAQVPDVVELSQIAATTGQPVDYFFETTPSPGNDAVTTTSEGRLQQDRT